MIIAISLIEKSLYHKLVQKMRLKKQEEQMNLSLCYHAVQIVLENAQSREKVSNI